MPQTSSAPYTSELAEALAPGVLDRFVRYARIDTQSNRAHERSPSTPGQLELARLLVEELREIGLEDAALDENGFVTATLAGNVPGAPVIGLLAHLDTTPDERGDGVEPLVHRGYNGGTIELPRGGTVLDPERMPELTAKLGHDIVTGSGDTLLGADDKAGMAEVMEAVAYLAAHPELLRATVKVGFTPDEEIGKGAFLFDIEALRRGVRVHVRRLGGGRVHRRDVHRGVRRRDDPRRRGPSRAWRRASSSTPRGSRAACSPRCRRTA